MVQRQAIRIYWIGFALAVGEAFLLFTFARLGAGFVLGTRTVLPVRGKTQPIGVIEVLGELPGGAGVPSSGQKSLSIW